MTSVAKARLADLAAAAGVSTATVSRVLNGKPGVRPDTRDAVLLCPFHHHQTHTTGDTHPLRT